MEEIYKPDADGPEKVEVYSSCRNRASRKFP